MCESEEWPIVHPRVFMIECYENYEVQFPPGVLPPRPHSIKFVYDLQGAGIEEKRHHKNDITPVRSDEDLLRVVASPPIPKPCTLSVRVVAAAGLSEELHFSLKFCSPMEYLYHKMRHDPYRESTVTIPKPIAKPLFMASLAYACNGGTISENSGPVMYDLKQQSGIQVASDSTLSSTVLGDHSEKNLLELCKENSWNALKHQLSSQQDRQQHPAKNLVKLDNPERGDSILSDFVESLKEQSLFKATACTDYIRKDQPSWLQLKKGDEVCVVDCTKPDRWYGISANNHGYFLPQYVTREEKFHDNHHKTSQVSIDDGFHSRTASVNSQANEVYVTMKSVLEALSGKLHVAASPSQSVAPPSSTSECHIYDYVPTNRTSAYRQQIQVPVTTSELVMPVFSPSDSNPRNSHFDVPRIATTQEPPMLSHSSIHETKPIPSPRQSPSQNRSQYAVPRPISSVTVESVYDVPRASNNQPLSPTSATHYDVLRITAQLPASKSQYDVPRLPAAEPMGSAKYLPRTSSDPDLNKDTIKVPSAHKKAYTPPVPRRFGNKAKSLDGNISYKDMKQHNSDVKKRDSKIKPLFRRRQT